jgi:hypothetical protein
MASGFASMLVCPYWIAVTPSHEADGGVAKCLLNANQDELDRILKDKAYLGLGIFTLSREGAKIKRPWTKLMGSARKLIETVFSSLAKRQHLVLES